MIHPNVRIDKLNDQEILDGWFNGEYASPRFHGGKSIPTRTPALEKYMLERYLASWRKCEAVRLGRLVTNMNEFWYGYKDHPDKPWAPAPRSIHPPFSCHDE